MAGEGWKNARFQELIDAGLLEIGDGYRAKNSELGGEGTIFLRAGHVTDTHIDFVGVDCFHAKLYERLRPKMAMPGDTIVTTKGNSTGRTAYVTETMPNFVYSPHLSYWRSLDDACIVPGFVRYWSRGREFLEQLAAMKASTDMAPYLSLTDQRRLRITLPTPPEQRAIAHILGTLDDKIELNRRMNETLEAMARALFKSWFVDFDPVRAKLEGRQPAGMDKATAALFPDAFEDSPLGKIPKGWRVGRITDCCQRTGNGGTPKRGVPAYWEPGTISWLTSGEVRQSIVTATENFISEQGLSNSSAKMWPTWTTVVALYGATAGQTCLLGTELCANQACCGLVPKPDWRFYNYLRVASSVELMAQQARGSAQQNLSKQIVEDNPTVLPPDALVGRFDNEVGSCFERWVANLCESRTLAALRDTLLPKLLSGEIRVPDAERIVGRHV